MWPSEPTKAHKQQGRLLYLNQLSGRLLAASCQNSCL